MGGVLGIRVDSKRIGRIVKGVDTGLTIAKMLGPKKGDINRVKWRENFTDLGLPRDLTRLFI